MTWHLLTGEYPPACGGVGDYTAALAQALADAGDEVHVWTPAAGTESSSRIRLHLLPDAFGPASRAALARAVSATPGIVLLQYVPNALGVKGANLAFCLWFSRLRRRVEDVRVMFHEPYFYFAWTRPWTPANVLALAQRAMARLLLRGATRVYFSTEAWRRYLRAPRGAAVLPIPSSIPAPAMAIDIARVREQAMDGGAGSPLIGHFGTYGAHVAGELEAILPVLVARVPDARVALLGSGGPAFLARLTTSYPDVARRAWAPGRLDASRLASALRACDLLVQPYPDGITTRRTSAMAGLKTGVPIVTTAGPLTEGVWTETGAVALVPAGDARGFAAPVERLLRDPQTRAALAARGAATYATRFSMAHTIAILRSAPAS